MVCGDCPNPPPGERVLDESADSDADGIPDREDVCPERAETRNGVLDGDGCPDADPVTPDAESVRWQCVVSVPEK